LPLADEVMDTDRMK